MTIRKTHDGENSIPTPKQSLRERALATYQAKSIDSLSDSMLSSTNQGLIELHELQVHKIELELQNEELRLSQVALEESRERYLDLYDRAPVGYCVIGANGLIQEANHCLAEMLGVSTGFLHLERFSKFIYPSDQDAFYLLGRRVASSPKQQSCELRMQKSDGTSTWAQLSASRASGEAALASLRVVIMDINARIQTEAANATLEAQLRESQKMEAVGTLAGGIAHDFNNVLAVILGNAELAQHFTGQTDPQTLYCLAEIQKAGERARDLVKQLLAFCRRQATDLKSICLEPIIAGSIRLLRSTMPARISLSFTCATDVPNVLADSTQIEQVVINLATNSMQAMKGGPGSIKIHLDTIERPSEIDNQLLTASHWRKYDKAVRLKFNDDGPGIDAAVMDRIFEPFFTTKLVNEGTGLGLAVVHGIIRDHDAEILVESKTGQGATFTIYFPPAPSIQIAGLAEQVVEPDAPEHNSIAATVDASTATFCTILYLDDDDMVLQSIVKLLSRHGVRVHGYTDQLAALCFLRAAAKKIDIVVTDYNMPGLSGLDVAKKVLEIQSDLPVIVTSGFIDEELHAHADAAGVRVLIPKPFSAKYFCDLAQQILNPSNSSQ